jgi:hypothetical protein
MKSNIAEIAPSPRQPRPAHHTPSAEARDELDLFRRTTKADILRNIAAGDERERAAQKEVDRWKAVSDSARAAMPAAPDPEALGKLKLEAEFAEQKLTLAEAERNTTDAARAAAHAALAAVQAEEREFINIILVSEAEGHMEKLRNALKEAVLPELRRFDAILAHFLRQQIPGLYIEKLGNLRRELRPYIGILNQHTVATDAAAKIAAMIDRL